MTSSEFTEADLELDQTDAEACLKYLRTTDCWSD